MKNNSSEKTILRKKAELLLTKTKKKTKTPLSDADRNKLLHELQVHQIELEMINEELRISRDKAEAASAKYQELYDFAPSGYLTLLADGTISQLNLIAARMLGRERLRLENKNFKLFVCEDSRGVFDDFFRKVFESNIRDHCEVELQVENGKSLFVYIEGTSDENKGECSLTMIDITDRRIMEEILKTTLAALERSNADLEQFAYIASHDLQEPLRMISSYIKLFEKRFNGTLDVNTRQYMEFIVDGANRMKTLIHDLLQYSKATSQKDGFVPTDLNAIIEDVFKDLQLAINDSEAEIKLDKLPVITANPMQMHQLFQNLIANAIKFRADKKPIINITFERKETNLEFSVRDNGIGIKPKFAERVFMIFQRLHERTAYPGTGIGLALCKKIVEQHGGRIWVESEEGEGSTFYFTLPNHSA